LRGRSCGGECTALLTYIGFEGKGRVSFYEICTYPYFPSGCTPYTYETWQLLYVSTTSDAVIPTKAPISLLPYLAHRVSKHVGWRTFSFGSFSRVRNMLPRARLASGSLGLTAGVACLAVLARNPHPIPKSLWIMHVAIVIPATVFLVCLEWQFPLITWNILTLCVKIEYPMYAQRFINSS
jgi:hypothetical protein